MMKTISVGFFKDSVEDPEFAGINDLVIKIIEAGDMKVTDVKSRISRESMGVNTDEFDAALELAMENIKTCEKKGLDYIVNTVSGYGMPLKEYDKLFVPGTSWHHRAKAFTDRVRDISEIMDMANLEFKHGVERNAVYQPPEEQGNIQRVFDEPVKIIKQIPGLNYIEMKRDEVQSAKPDLIITSHPGRQTQLDSEIGGDGISDQVEVKHIVEVVAESCGIAANQ